MIFIQDFIDGKENKRFVGARFNDLYKAFDNVNHTTLYLILNSPNRCYLL